MGLFCNGPLSPLLTCYGQWGISRSAERDQGRHPWTLPAFL